jgi:hypothetical protein
LTGWTTFSPRCGWSSPTAKPAGCEPGVALGARCGSRVSRVFATVSPVSRWARDLAHMWARFVSRRCL